MFFLLDSECLILSFTLHSQRDIGKFLERLYTFGTWMYCIGIVWIVHEIIQLRRKFKALDSDDYEIVQLRRKFKALDSDDH